MLEEEDVNVCESAFHHNFVYSFVEHLQGLRHLHSQTGLAHAHGPSQLASKSLPFSSLNFSMLFFMQNLENLRKLIPTGTLWMLKSQKLTKNAV